MIDTRLMYVDVRLLSLIAPVPSSPMRKRKIEGLDWAKGELGVTRPGVQTQKAGLCAAEPHETQIRLYFAVQDPLITIAAVLEGACSQKHRLA